jgi:cytochrome c oxidase subunit 2
VRSSLLVLVGIISMVSAVAVHAADAAAGKSAYSVCSTCHAANGGGNQSLNAPRLTGQLDWYLKRQLQAFKDGIRGTAAGDIYGAQMRPMAMTLANEAAIDNVVAYIGTLTAPAPTATVQGDAAAGKQLYATCAACHGPKGEGNVALNSPRLTDQDDWYLVRELQNYKKGIRGGNPKDTFGAQMKPMAAMLANDQAINNVVVYIRSLK